MGQMCCVNTESNNPDKIHNRMFNQKEIENLEWYKMFLPKHDKQLDVIHFNDVYNIDERVTNDDNEMEIKAGAARFVRALNLYGSQEKLVIFSGDLLYPSSLSIEYEGEQTIYPFQKTNVDVSCLGNHELDNGIPHGVKMMAKTKCPWVMTNLFEKDKDMKPIAGCKQYHVMDHSGFKIGFMGFAEKEWMDTFTTDIDCSLLHYIDYNEKIKETSKILKDENKCDLIIAINHMKVPEDEKMAAANSSPDVLDMIFGGHDHTYHVSLNQDTGVFIQKSGTDFECFTNLTVLFGVEENDFIAFKDILKEKMQDWEEIELFYKSDMKRMFISERVNITNKFAPERKIYIHVKKYTDQFYKLQEKPAFCSQVEIDGRFSRVRSEETNIGNWLSDLMRTEYNDDFSILNGGCLRANRQYDAGPLTYKFMSEMLPMEDKVVRYKVTGEIFKKALENGVSNYPSYDGRWPVTSGIKYTFDPSKEPGDRILPESLILLSGETLQMDKTYTVAAKYFVAAGKDGYDCMLDPSVKCLCGSGDLDECPTIQKIILNHFKNLQKTNEEIEVMPDKQKKRLMERLALLNTNINNRCEETGFIRIAPMQDARILCTGEPLQHQD